MMIDKGNVNVRNIDWEINLVMSSKNVSSLDQPLLTVHLSDGCGSSVSLELNQDEMEKLKKTLLEAKMKMEDSSTNTN